MSAIDEAILSLARLFFFYHIQQYTPPLCNTAEQWSVNLPLISWYCGTQVGFKGWNQKWRGVHYPAGGPRMRLCQSTKLSGHTTHESAPAPSPHVPHSRSMEERASEARNYSDKSPSAYATLHSLDNSLEYCYKVIYNSKVNCLLWAAGNAHLPGGFILVWFEVSISISHHYLQPRQHDAVFEQPGHEDLQ